MTWGDPEMVTHVDGGSLVHTLVSYLPSGLLSLLCLGVHPTSFPSPEAENGGNISSDSRGL